MFCNFLGVMSPGGPPFPPQGLLGFGGPRPPMMGYGGECVYNITGHSSDDLFS